MSQQTITTAELRSEKGSDCSSTQDYNNPWIELADGQYFYLHQSPNDSSAITIENIGSALANLCRYNGHCSEFYSIAEHSVLVSYLVPPELALEGLLHDASEAFISDISSPFKSALTNYSELETGISKRIATRFGLEEGFEEDLLVREADVAMLMFEADKLLPSKGKGWGYTTNIDVKAKLPSVYHDLGWSPKHARSRFLTRYEEVMEERLAQ